MLVGSLKKYLSRIDAIRKVKSIVHDIHDYYMVRRIKNRSARIQEDIKRFLQEGGAINVYFVFTQCQLWGLQSVYEEMLVRDTFNPFVIVMPNTEDCVSTFRESHDANMEFFRNLGVRVISGLDQQSNIKKITDIIEPNSIVFFDQPYPNLPCDWSFYNVSRYSLITYVPYGFKVAKSYKAHFDQLLHNISWRVFAETEWHRKQFVKLGKRKGDNIVVSGYPKFDAYKQAVNDNDKFSNYIKAVRPKKKIIIWAPHWSINDQFLGYSTFDLYHEIFKRVATDNKSIHWIFKPHQRLQYHVIETGFMGSSEVREYYQFWRNNDNTDYYGEGDYFDLFKISDALITDSGSFLAEYLPTGKPVLLLRSKNTVGYNELGEKIVRSYYQASQWKDIENFIKYVVLCNRDEMKAKRESLIPLVLPNLTETAGKFITRDIETVLLQSIR